MDDLHEAAFGTTSEAGYRSGSWFNTDESHKTANGGPPET
jgi:hypothetical protein